MKHVFFSECIVYARLSARHKPFALLNLNLGKIEIVFSCGYFQPRLILVMNLWVVFSSQELLDFCHKSILNSRANQSDDEDRFQLTTITIATLSQRPNKKQR